MGYCAAIITASDLNAGLPSNDNVNDEEKINNSTENVLEEQKEEAKIEDDALISNNPFEDASSSESEVLKSEKDAFAKAQEEIKGVSTKIKKKSKYRYVILLVLLSLVVIGIMLLYVYLNYNSPQEKARRKMFSDYCSFYEKQKISNVMPYLDKKYQKLHQDSLLNMYEKGYNIQCSFNYKNVELKKKDLSRVNDCLGIDAKNLNFVRADLKIKTPPKDKTETSTYIIYGLDGSKVKIYEVTNILTVKNDKRDKLCTFKLKLGDKEV